MNEWNEDNEFIKTNTNLAIKILKRSGKNIKIKNALKTQKLTLTNILEKLHQGPSKVRPGYQLSTLKNGHTSRAKRYSRSQKV